MSSLAVPHGPSAPAEPRVPEPAPPRRRASAAAAATFCLVAARLAALPRLGLFNDEAYYWEWSRHLAGGYYDHPPAVAYLIAASTRLLGRSEVAVHLPAFLLSLATSAVLFRLALDLFPGRRDVAWWAVAASNAAPLFALGAAFTTPDAPATFCWVLAMWLAWRATHGRPRAWYGAGAAVGLGALSKYSAALSPLALLAWLALPRQRGWLRRREPWLAALLALVVAAPVLVWNARHGWDSLSFQLVDRHLGPWQPVATLRRYLVAQQAVSPLLWLLCMAALVRSVALARRGSEAHAFLACCAGTVLAFFGVFALHTWVNANWTGIAYLPLLLSAADLAASRRWPVRVVPVATAALATVAIHAQALWLPFPVGGRNDLAADLHGWGEVAARVEALRAGFAAPARSFVYARRFQLAALVAFHLGDDVEVTRLGGRPDAYDAWRDPERLRGRDAVLLADDWNPITLEEPFERCDPAGELPIVRRGRVLRTFRFWRCRSYRP